MTSHVLTLPVMEVERARLSHRRPPPHPSAPPAASPQSLTRNISALHSSIMNDTGSADSSRAEAADEKGAGIIHDDTYRFKCAPRFDSNGP